jgi:pyruvate dehydrogenase E2 component (dihydrolipoamide acetyltransferase)
VSDLAMPRLSDTMEEGTVLRWLKRNGEQVQRGEELVEIETDKAAMIYESDSEGVLQIVAGEGDTLAVGELIARIGQADSGETDNPEADNGGSHRAEAAPRDPANAAETVDALVEQPASPSSARSTAPAVTPNGSPSKQNAPTHGERVKASPLARRVAREQGIELTGLTGSGPGGRIVKADVELARATPVKPATSVAASTAPPVSSPAVQPARTQELGGAKGDTTVVELSRTQRTIARRMAESKATIPDFTLTAEVDMEECVKLRAELKRLSQAETPTYNDMIVKACALALREHPRANGSYRDGHFELHSRVNVGVAVAVSAAGQTAGALVVPTVLDADAKALGEIARETRALAERVRDASITPPELSGATFTVSNLGMYGIASFTAIVNPPQAAILAVGAVAPRAVARKKKLVARHTMNVTLACDHRILYGADAALFLARIRELLEEPAALTL